MNLEPIEYKGWFGYEVSQGDLALILVPQVGGRLMGLRWRDQEIFFTHPGLAGHIEAVAEAKDVRKKKSQLGFLFWGGEKTWLAPQSAWTDAVPFLDLDSGAYDFRVVTANRDKICVQMTSPVCRESGMQIVRTITLEPTMDTWETRHCLINASSKPSTWAPWSVSMVSKPASVYLPRRQGSRHPDGVKTFRDEGESEALRSQVLHELGNVICVDCSDPRKFKYGVDSLEGWVFGILQPKGHGLVGYIKRVPVFADEWYPDHCTLEVFSSGEYPYFEMETLGPTVRLLPGQSFEMTEKQRVFSISSLPDSEETVLRLVHDYG